MTNRTTHRSKDGDEIDAQRDELDDVRTYERAPGQEIERSSKTERERKG